MKKNSIINSLENLRDLSKELMNDSKFINSYENIKERVIKALENKNTIFFCGNGGSFADAQHLTAELIVRFKQNRQSLNAITLGANQCNLTAIGNDFSFDDIFVRELSALYKTGDEVVILSTSGNSLNTLKVAKYLIKHDHIALSILGKGGGELKQLTQNIIIPSDDTALIQEITILIGHNLCSEIEKNFIK